MTARAVAVPGIHSKVVVSTTEIVAPAVAVTPWGTFSGFTRPADNGKTPECLPRLLLAVWAWDELKDFAHGHPLFEAGVTGGAQVFVKCQSEPPGSE
jgi:hypothetical protein